MTFLKLSVALGLLVIIIILNVVGISAKSLASDDSQSQTQQQSPDQPPKPVETISLSPQVAGGYSPTVPQSHHNGEVNYPQYEDENMGSYDYPSSSSEEMMPVKNSEFVPVESKEDYNSTDGFVPQRQVSLQDFWQQYHNSMIQQQNTNNNKGNVKDEGEFEVVSIGNQPGAESPQLYQPQIDQHQPYPQEEYQQQQQQHQIQQNHPYYQIPNVPNQQYYEELLPIATPTPSVLPPMPSTPKISKVAKLTVIAGRNQDGKIAVVKDKSRVNRQKRSMMTLSREDENDSEYDDVNSSEKKSKITSTTEKLSSSSPATNHV